jgi:hypothetical protein
MPLFNEILWRKWYGKPIIELLQKPGETLYVPRYTYLYLLIEYWMYCICVTFCININKFTETNNYRQGTKVFTLTAKIFLCHRCHDNQRISLFSSLFLIFLFFSILFFFPFLFFAITSWIYILVWISCNRNIFKCLHLVLLRFRLLLSLWLSGDSKYKCVALQLFI